MSILKIFIDILQFFHNTNESIYRQILLRKKIDTESSPLPKMKYFQFLQHRGEALWRCDVIRRVCHRWPLLTVWRRCLPFRKHTFNLVVVQTKYLSQKCTKNSQVSDNVFQWNLDIYLYSIASINAEREINTNYFYYMYNSFIWWQRTRTIEITAQHNTIFQAIVNGYLTVIANNVSQI
jgi:hypothetical protein